MKHVMRQPVVRSTRPQRAKGMRNFCNLAGAHSTRGLNSRSNLNPKPSQTQLVHDGLFTPNFEVHENPDIFSRADTELVVAIFCLSAESRSFPHWREPAKREHVSSSDLKHVPVRAMR